MSINLFGTFYDSKDRRVAELSFRQTPTSLSYRIVGSTGEIELTRDNFEKVLAPYFDPANGMVGEPYKTEEEKIEAIKNERIEEYEAYKKKTSFFNEDYWREVIGIDKPIPKQKTIFGKHWKNKDEWHITELLETFDKYIDDYKCLLFVM